MNIDVFGTSGNSSGKSGKVWNLSRPGQRAAVAVGQAIAKATRTGCNAYGPMAKWCEMFNNSSGKPMENQINPLRKIIVPDDFFLGHDGRVPIFRHVCMQTMRLGHGETLDFSWETKVKNYNQKLVGGLEHQFYFPINIGLLIIPIDELIFFRGVAQPPTRQSKVGLDLHIEGWWCTTRNRNYPSNGQFLTTIS